MRKLGEFPKFYKVILLTIELEINILKLEKFDLVKNYFVKFLRGMTRFPHVP